MESTEACKNEIALLRAELSRWRKRAEDAEYRLEHPPLAENQDELARICFEAYMGYVSPDSDNTWDEIDAWESYGWRLAANAVRVACDAELARVKKESLRVVPVDIKQEDCVLICDVCDAEYDGCEHLPDEDYGTVFAHWELRSNRGVAVTSGDSFADVIRPERLERWPV